MHRAMTLLLCGRRPGRLDSPLTHPIFNPKPSFTVVEKYKYQLKTSSLQWQVLLLRNIRVSHYLFLSFFLSSFLSPSHRTCSSMQATQFLEMICSQTSKVYIFVTLFPAEPVLGETRRLWLHRTGNTSAATIKVKLRFGISLFSSWGQICPSLL